jgi:hypothetical protein
VDLVGFFIFINMAKDKKGFILYADQKALFEQLPNDKAGELIKFIFAYVNDENPETEDLIINLAFTPIKQQLKRDLIKFEETKGKRSEAGKAGANKRWQNIANDSKRISDIAKIAVNVNDNVNVKEKVIDINIRKQEFANSLIPFVDVYGKDMIREFYDYWSETTLNNKKMKYELEKTWSVERRLKTWSKNSAKFGGALPKQEQEKFKAAWQ